MRTLDVRIYSSYDEEGTPINIYDHINGAYLIGEFKGEDKFISNIGVGSCRDSFLATVHSRASKGKDIEFILMVTHEAAKFENKILPSLLLEGGYSVYTNLSDTYYNKFVQEKICVEKGKIYGIYVKLPVELYFDPAIFWDITNLFRWRICATTRTAVNQGWYGGSDYLDFKLYVNQYLKAFTPVKHEDVDIIGRNSPASMSLFLRNMQRNILSYMHTYAVKPSDRKNLIGTLVGARAELESFQRAHPVLKTVPLSAHELSPDMLIQTINRLLKLLPQQNA